MSLNIILLTLYSATLYFLSDQPSIPTPMMFHHQDKFIHFGAYAVMGLLAWRSCEHLKFSVNIKAVIALSYCLIFALSDEWHQSFVPGRNADIYDWIADAIGATSIIGWLALKSK